MRCACTFLSDAEVRAPFCVCVTRGERLASVLHHFEVVQYQAIRAKLSLEVRIAIAQSSSGRETLRLCASALSLTSLHCALGSA